MFMKVNPLLGKYSSLTSQCEEPCLVVSFVLDGGIMSAKGNVSPAMTLNSINGKRVNNLKQLATEASKESAFYKVQFHDNVHVIISNNELVNDHQFISATFGGMLKDTTLVQPVAFVGADCLVGDAHVGCETCGKNPEKDASHIEHKFSEPKKKNKGKNNELEILLKNAPEKKLVSTEEVVTEELTEPVQVAMDYDEYEIEQMKAALPAEMLAELGIF